MDTITHGIAGALIAKAVFGGRDLYTHQPEGKSRVVTWSVMLGSIFPDADVFRDFFSKNDLLMITWHRSITHSLLCLPVWAALLAAGTLALCRWRKWSAPSFAALLGLYAIGIFSHIFLDLVTTYGTMIWSPIAWSRPAWDILFIVDFTFTAILLVPQLLAWAYSDPDHQGSRAMLLWIVFTPLPLILARIAAAVGVNISSVAVLIATGLFAVLFLLPARRNWGLGVRYVNWNRAGLALAILYISAATLAHRAALHRVEAVAATLGVQTQNIGALPLPPSLWSWDGLVRSPRGVYEWKLDLSDTLWGKKSASSETIQRTYYPDAFPNSFIDAARRLPEVQKVLWFDRFPVTRFHTEGTESIVEISDLRFPRVRPDRTPSFTYRVRFGSDGSVLSQGWVKP